MSKEKGLLIVLLAALMIVGIIAFTIYSEKENLAGKNISLGKEKASLSAENDSLRSKYKSLHNMYANNKKRMNDIQDELSRALQDKEELKNKYSTIYKERARLISQIKTLSEAKRTQAPVPARTMREAAKAPSTSDKYWSDVVREKAELEVRLDNFKNQLLSAKTEISRLQKGDKELSLKIDELTQTKDKLEANLSFKERTMEIMSRDLVNEREERDNLANEVSNLRNNNMNLKRELIVANRDKMKLQTALKDAIDEKDKLEKTVANVNNVLKEKKMMFSELEGQLAKAVSGRAKTSNNNSASVELPPIVVKPNTSETPSRAPLMSSSTRSYSKEASVRPSSSKSLKGEVLAVNKNDNFVIIDLGEDTGVKPGLKFNIMRSGNTIGNIEVIETRKEISAADIKSVNRGYTIHEGDKVVLQ